MFFCSGRMWKVSTISSCYQGLRFLTLLYAPRWTKILWNYDPKLLTFLPSNCFCQIFCHGNTKVVNTATLYSHSAETMVNTHGMTWPRLTQSYICGTWRNCKAKPHVSLLSGPIDCYLLTAWGLLGWCKGVLNMHMFTLRVPTVIGWVKQTDTIKTFSSKFTNYKIILAFLPDWL